jgi:threonine dehydrogenase-like Zn-dependent dehydrogenase
VKVEGQDEVSYPHPLDVVSVVAGSWRDAVRHFGKGGDKVESQIGSTTGSSIQEMSASGRKGGFMKALWFDKDAMRLAPAFAPFQYGDVEEPVIPSPRWLKVKNRRCGLCATDVHIAFIDLSPKAFPVAVPGGGRRMYLGHEIAGEVLEVGAEVTGFAPGERITQRIAFSSCSQMEISPPCRQCAAGNHSLCENVGVRPGESAQPGAGFSPFMVMHRSEPFRIPPEVTDDGAVLLEPTAVAVHAVLRRKPKAGDKVLVVGGGTIGLLTLAAVRALQPDASVYVSARYPFQAEQAERMGAHGVFLGRDATYQGIEKTCGARLISAPFDNRIVMGGFDLVYDSVGIDASVADSLRWVRARGTVVLIGANLKPGGFDYSPVWYREVDFTGSNCYGTEESGETTFEIAARLLAEDRIRVDGMITHRFPLSDYRAAISTFLSKEKSKAIKVVLEHTGS